MNRFDMNFLAGKDKLNYSATPYAFTIALVLFFISLAIGTLTPNFQSPDEDTHIKRAYLLGHGHIWLDSPNGVATGGNIDSGLLQAIEQFSYLPFHGEQKITANLLYEAKQVQWTGSNIFSPTSGTSFYFPLIYAPQAAGIRLGELFHLSVYNSYLLAKVFALLTACALIFWAMNLFAFSNLSLGLLILPMSIFQLGSASQDGVANALTLVVIALFLKLSKDKEHAPAWYAYFLAFAIALLATSRMQLVPLLLLLFVAYKLTSQKRYVWMGAATTLFSLGWIIATLITVVDPKVRTSLSPLEVIQYYLLHPRDFIAVVANTLTNIPTIKSYTTSFIGVLGWLDASLPKGQYTYIGFLLLVLLSATFTFKPKNISRTSQVSLIFCAIGSIAIIFISLLAQWTPHPAQIILGIQGRYFLSPALLLSAAFTQRFDVKAIGYKAMRPIISYLTLALLAISSLTLTSQLLLQRYYLMPERNTLSKSTVDWSQPLSNQSSITVSFSPYQANSPATLQGISIFINTPSNSGKAILELSDKLGAIQTIPIEYVDGMQSRYLAIPIPPNKYISGKIRASAGEGLQIKGVVTDQGFKACLVYELDDGSRRYTPGCP
jgi:uncharacterized membrane protein